MVRSFAILLAAAFGCALATQAVHAQPRRPFGQRPGRAPDRLSEGDTAPDFKLRRMGSKEDDTVTLSDFQDDRPVALVFGSYT